MEWQKVKSQKMYEEAKKFIPGGSTFIDRRPPDFMRGEYPLFFKHSTGSHLIDVDDNEYIDYVLCYGPILLGYNYPSVMEAVNRVLKNGWIFSSNHPLMIELAKKLIEVIPGAEMTYFFKTGSDVVTAAVKIARSYTGKEKIVRCAHHYHGWHDWCRIREKGVPRVLSEYTLTTEFNDLDSVEKLLEEKGEEIACFILEPMKPIAGALRIPKGYLELPKREYLEGIRDLTKRYNVVLIFDEVKVGFRLALGGAREYYKIIPDISTYSKGMGNGFPVGAVVGMKEIMESAEGDSLKSTFGEEAIGMAAALAVINEIETKNVIRHIWDVGRQLIEGLNDLAKDLDVEARCLGLPPVFRLFFEIGQNESNKRLEEIFFQECVRRGILFPLRALWYVCYSHSSEDIDKTLEVCEDALRIAKNKVPCP